MSALQSALAELRACADTGSSAALLADECAALTAEIDRLTAALAERDDLRARIGNARAEIARQDTAATFAMRPGYCDVSDALAAVETHLKCGDMPDPATRTKSYRFPVNGSPEAMQRRCSMCGFSWLERPLDASEPQNGPQSNELGPGDATDAEGVNEARSTPEEPALVPADLSGES